MSTPIIVRHETIPQTPGPERANWFRAELLKRGVQLRQLAAELGVNPNTIYLVLRGYARSRRVEQKICEILGLEWSQAFPPLRSRRQTP